MNTISVTELASIRADLTNAVCETSCVIKRITDVKDSWGTSTETLNTIAMVNVGIERPNPSILQAYASITASQATWVVHFPYGQDVRQRDQLVIGTKTLVVQEILDPHSYAGMVNVLVSEVR